MTEGATTAPSVRRLERQIAFLVEIDRLKSVIRQTLLCDGSRRENTAEHSWHLALMAVVLAEHAGDRVDVPRAVQMLLVHDLVEIDAGDTFAYDVQGNTDKAARERRAAERVFGLLPPEQGEALRALWEEFEAQETAEARYATALDRLQPLLSNDRSDGGSWRAHGVRRGQVLGRMEPIRSGTPALWPLVEEIVSRNCELGHIVGDREA